jgi:sigma-54-interacting transcriptional regulator
MGISPRAIPSQDLLQRVRESSSDITFDPNRSTHGPGFRVQPADDWLVIRTSRANMLVSGPGEATRAFMVAVTPHLHQPVQDGSACDALPIAPTDGTLILRDVDALDREQQQRLLRWLAEPQNGLTQVISLTSTRLYGLVQTGTFLEQLYYRLNVTQFEVISD